MKKNILSLIIVIVLIITLVYYFYNQPKEEIIGDVHIHADFKLYINGNEFNFSQEKYMTENKSSRSQFVHLHDLDGNVIHVHISGVTIGEFFKSINMQFNSTCLVTDLGGNYCNNGNKEIRFYVNGEKNKEFNNYVIKDLDKILITYGDNNSEEINKELSSITDKACIQSGKCPERGSPSNESSCLTLEGCDA